MDDILFEIEGAVGRVTLNRPRALNALTLDMARRLDARLIEWASDDGVGAVVIGGAGERAFCAGGDVRALYDSMRTPGDAYTAGSRCRTITTSPMPWRWGTWTATSSGFSRAK